MTRFVEGCDRGQSTFFPALLDDYVADDNPVRAIDAFVDGLDLGKHGFTRVEPLVTGRPSYHPATLLKIYLYGLNRVPSSRPLGAGMPAQYRDDLADRAVGSADNGWGWLSFESSFAIIPTAGRGRPEWGWKTSAATLFGPSSIAVAQ